MGYTEGTNKVLASIIDDIANGLMGSLDMEDLSIHWSDADATWKATTIVGNNTVIISDAKRALKYQNGTEIIYLSLEVRNTWYTPYSGYTAKGLRITFSSSWNDTSHTYAGTIQQTSIPFVSHSGSQPTVDLATTNIIHYLWIESNGFVLMAKPTPTPANSDNSFFAVVERCPNKFYNDNHTNFYCYNVMNIWPTLCSTSYGEPDQHRSFLRPFIYKWPNANVSNLTPNTYCLTFGYFDRSYAFKSAVSGKAYYFKPMIFNNMLDVGQSPIGINPMPIFQSNLWFYWSENMGLDNNDIIAMEGLTTKYQVKALDSSPDSNSKVTYAMKFVA